MAMSKATQDFQEIADIMAELALIAIAAPWDLTEKNVREANDDRPHMAHAKTLLILVGNKIAQKLSAREQANG